MHLPLNPPYTVEPCYNEVLGTMKITLLYQVSHYIRVKKPKKYKELDQQNYLVITGFCYKEVPLYSFNETAYWKGIGDQQWTTSLCAADSHYECKSLKLLHRR